jgi:hypothetical protein
MPHERGRGAVLLFLAKDPLFENLEAPLGAPLHPTHVVRRPG